MPVTDYSSGFYQHFSLHKIYYYSDLDIQTESRKAAEAAEKFQTAKWQRFIQFLSAQIVSFAIKIYLHLYR